VGISAQFNTRRHLLYCPEIPRMVKFEIAAPLLPDRRISKCQTSIT
jgi:hypothetical protein